MMSVKSFKLCSIQSWLYYIIQPTSILDCMDNSLPILHMTVGLPRSGKSTWANKTGWPMVNPDSIRLALHGQRFVAQAEPMVWTIAQTMVNALFIAGHRNVILDATNTRRARRDEWRRPLLWNRHFHINETPRHLCIERAMVNNDLEIVPVINAMAVRYEPVDEKEHLSRWTRI